MENYEKHYSEEKFRDKIRRYAKTIGRDLLEKAFVLYYVGIDPDTPRWAKGVIAAALGYFIFPMDAIPDFAPFAGYADDAGAIAAALAAIAACISKEHIGKAKAKMKALFPRTGEDDEEIQESDEEIEAAMETEGVTTEPAMEDEPPYPGDFKGMPHLYPDAQPPHDEEPAPPPPEENAPGPEPKPQRKRFGLW